MPKRTKSTSDEQEKINVRERLTDNVLDLSLMNIATIPVNDIKILKRATILDLSNNAITVINKNFTSLVQLTKLDLSNNRIQLITDDFGNLVNLRHLNLYSNKIERLPLSFGRLKKLKYLDLKNNPLNPAFSKIIGTCIDQKGCIDAARKAIAFMADIERQVLEERRKEREQKEKESRQIKELSAKETHLQEKENVDTKKKKRTKRSRGSSISKENKAHDESVLNSTNSHTNEPNLITHETDSNTRFIAKKFILIIVALILLAYVIFLKAEVFIDFLNQPDIQLREEYIK
ncbi:leucine-rich repeat-containing protein 59 [Topomyia yanbarensis]|uniref:leucine-rich repeat-containing protein 59 n=1 Tax=Topomyia yanbarensis TaxID=2498891 RepID=UPI00273C4DEE|nr:leucine-rich repeat-containing protein 59 [Topomyia yanbarensis]